ncbi:SDR family NAD(P)-dependent oxidoreductase [Rubinisphaera margarita]|uniref:SDR family NAD(P)-dependent oxidoreductase n=1 Tax=Rubinisphaera margarita TaxID=2909586 RepID=UPI001EE8D81E|nr:SDR family oxidoreductase [Rubinisphaera margarita]MCG6157445.1 SDR family oxidoreductase [Rubinisphaera margarita]
MNNQAPWTTNHPFDVDEPVMLVTGGGRHRVGSVIARYFAARSYALALHYHSSEEEAQEGREELRKDGTRCEIFKADVTSEADVSRMVEAVYKKFGRIDALVTTASIWSPRPWAKVTADDLRKNFDVNTLGTFLCAKAVGEVMIQQPTGGAIVTFGDSSINRPYLDFAPYFISKGAIPTLTQVLAVELADRNPNVRVNCIHPGPVMLPPDTDDDKAARIRELTLLKTADRPDMVAQAVEALVNNVFMTGVCLPVDAGKHMHCPAERRRP